MFRWLAVEPSDQALKKALRGHEGAVGEQHNLHKPLVCVRKRKLVILFLSCSSLFFNLPVSCSSVILSMSLSSVAEVTSNLKAQEVSTYERNKKKATQSNANLLSTDVHQDHHITVALAHEHCGIRLFLGLCHTQHQLIQFVITQRAVKIHGTGIWSSGDLAYP